MDHKVHIVDTCAQFDALVANAPAVVAADVETRGAGPALPGSALLGIALAFWAAPSLSLGNDRQIVALYVPFSEWSVEKQTLLPVGESGLLDRVSLFLSERELIGHNIEYDRQWINYFFKIISRWKADTRKMWHLADDTDAPHGFGLKVAQVKVLGWEESNDKALREVVEERGGKLSNGDHYLAPVDKLGFYAGLDGISTLLLFDHLTPFFDKFDYWGFLQWRQDFHPILTEATADGVEVDAPLLIEAKEELVVAKENAIRKIREVCKTEIEGIEKKWFEDDAGSFAQEHAKKRFLEGAKGARKRRVFNSNSPDQRAFLFHEVIGIPVVERSKKTGKPSTARPAIQRMSHPAAKVFIELSEIEAVRRLAQGYVDSLKERNGKYWIHFPYNTSATVSDRLGGFAPYALNMPFSEEKLMSAFKLPVGCIGVHADLSALEPCLIAAFSEDPTLMKVHRDGLGDVYLDLALSLFPDNVELKAAYNPMVPADEAVKKRFKKLRDVAKIIHLAVGYTGNYKTVWRNLQKAGMSVTESEAARLVNRYWETFWRVKEFEDRLKALHKRDGHIRNVMGRVLRIPKKFEKDTMNRFIQSGGHDCLVAWVKEIDRRRKDRPELGMKPVLPDIHDSTSWVVKEEFYAEAKQIFEESLQAVNVGLGLPVQLRAEVKPFRTFAGLKGDER